MTDIVPDTSRHRASGLLALVVVVLATSVLPACSPGRTEARTDLEWPWWPNRMWISDITRVGRAGPDGVRPLEVRICFEDRDGDRTKASGELEIRVDRPTERDEPVVVVVEVVPVQDTPSFFHDRVVVRVSPSASVEALVMVQTRSSSSSGSVGVRVMVGVVGALLTMVAVPELEAPLTVPSLGVTVTAKTSPRSRSELGTDGVVVVP